jgi:hypothetical protein
MASTWHCTFSTLGWTQRLCFRLMFNTIVLTYQGVEDTHAARFDGRGGGSLLKFRRRAFRICVQELSSADDRRLAAVSTR